MIQKNKIKRLVLSVIVISSISLNVFAKEQTAEDLIKTMKKEDITYAQLMDAMVIALNNIQEGIIAMNKVLVDDGINFIRTHPAPRKKPWVIMDEKYRDSFKSTLLYFDKKMDEDVLAIEKAVNKKDWNKALESLNTFQNTCMACHTSWKNEVKYIMK